MRRTVTRAPHLLAFTSLLAADPQTRDISMRHLQMLAVICQHDGPLSVGELAALLDLSSSVTSRALDRLVAHKLIDRVEHPDDRRITAITATIAGHALDARVLRCLEVASEPLTLPAA
jgi:DNA-binding MarR family transcriptional regulator